jgi:hypothetical protein
MQRRALQLAGSSSELLSTYSMVLEFLKNLPKSQIMELGGTKELAARKFSKQLIGDHDFELLSLDAIEKIVTDEKSPRGILERIAIARFHVPKGSMRSFQNMEMLREKLLIRIQNERTHQTIGEMARSSRGENKS